MKSQEFSSMGSVLSIGQKTTAWRGRMYTNEDKMSIKQQTKRQTNNQTLSIIETETLVVSAFC